MFEIQVREKCPECNGTGLHGTPDAIYVRCHALCDKGYVYHWIPLKLAEQLAHSESMTEQARRDSGQEA
jgi:hypothetical protein